MQEDENDHVAYKAARMMGGKTDLVKEELVKEDIPFVPQQLTEKSIQDFPNDVQAKTVKKIKNQNYRFSSFIEFISWIICFYTSVIISVILV